VGGVGELCPENTEEVRLERQNYADAVIVTFLLVKRPFQPLAQLAGVL